MGDLVSFGKIVKGVSGLHKGSDEIVITFSDDSVFYMKHYQDCCENVSVEDIDGDLSSILGGVWIGCEESTKNDPEDDYGIGMWTFYTIKTSKGYVWIRWYGSSNGYYSVSVSHGYASNEDEISRW